MGTGLSALLEVLETRSRLMLIDVRDASHCNIDGDELAIQALTNALNANDSSVLFYLEVERRSATGRCEDPFPKVRCHAKNIV